MQEKYSQGSVHGAGYPSIKYHYLRNIGSTVIANEIQVAYTWIEEESPIVLPGLPALLIKTYVSILSLIFTIMAQDPLFRNETKGAGQRGGGSTVLSKFLPHSGRTSPLYNDSAIVSTCTHGKSPRLLRGYARETCFPAPLPPSTGRTLEPVTCYVCCSSERSKDIGNIWR